MREAQLAQRVNPLGAQHPQALDFDIAQAHAEGQRRRARRALAAFADLDLELGDAQRIDQQAAAERGGEMRVRADVARLDARAVGQVPQALDADHARERAAGADDLELAAAALACLLERPMQPGLGREQPDDRSRERQQHEAEQCRGGEEQAFRQKPYPTEKCRRMSPVSSP